MKTFKETGLPQDEMLEEIYNICKEQIEYAQGGVRKMLKLQGKHSDEEIEELINEPEAVGYLTGCPTNLDPIIEDLQKNIFSMDFNMKDLLSAATFRLLITASRLAEQEEETLPDLYDELPDFLSEIISPTEGKDLNSKLSSFIKKSDFTKELVQEAMMTWTPYFDISTAPVGVKLLAAIDLAEMPDEEIKEMREDIWQARKQFYLSKDVMGDQFAITSKESFFEAIEYLKSKKTAFNKSAKAIQKDEIPASLHKKMMKTVKKVNAVF